MNQVKRDLGRNVTAIILIGLGALFLLGQWFDFSLFGVFWPLLVLLPGAAFLYFAVISDRGAAGLAVPGAIIGGTGLVLMYQNLTGHWESWAYVWTLYPVFLGMSLSFIGRRTDNPQTARTGEGFIRWGLVAFIGMWALFELFLFGGNRFVGSTLLPLLLIGAGIYLLYRGRSTVPGIYEKPKVSTNGHRRTPSQDLQTRIDEALREPDDDQPRG